MVKIMRNFKSEASVWKIGAQSKILKDILTGETIEFIKISWILLQGYQLLFKY